MIKSANDIITQDLEGLEPFVVTNNRKTYYIENKDATIVKYQNDAIRVYFDRISDLDNLPCRFRFVQYFNDSCRQEGKIEMLED